MVNRDGIVCGIVFSGNSRADEWPGSRVISGREGEHCQRSEWPGLRAFHRKHLCRVAARPEPLLAGHQRAPEPGGGLGLSGETSCTDHIIAWKVRAQLKLDAVPMGPSPVHNDNMILVFQNGSSPSGFGHPSRKGRMQSDGIIRDLSKDFPTGPHR